MITTIITTYQRSHLLKRAIESVLNQDYSEFQVCIYDNASQDDTEAVVLDYVKKDPRVKYHRHPINIGMMGNYQYAFSQVKTPYFSFLSDDDYLLPHFFSTALGVFQTFPQAAFAACGVLQMDEKGQVVRNPLASWQREGLFQAPEGMSEMIRSHGKFPVPTGILFQNAMVKKTPPDWSHEIQIMWDPNYLLQIASQFPIAINKKSCAVFSVHEGAFSSSFYSQIRGSAEGFKSYLTATNRILTHLMTNPFLSNAVKESTKKSFETMMRKEVSVYLYQYLIDKRFSEVSGLISIFGSFFEGMDVRIRFLYLLNKMNEKVPLVYPLTRMSLLTLRGLVRSARVFVRKLPLRH